jgi:hypothetical protein
MALITLDSAVVWVYTSKLNVFAEVISAIQAEKAYATWDARLYSHTIT